MRTNLSYLESMTEGNKELIAELIGIFSTQVVEYSEQMLSLFKDKNWSELSKMAHKAKSSVAIMGMKDLSDELKRLEIMARKGEDEDSYEAIIDHFAAECKEAVSELQQYK